MNPVQSNTNRLHIWWKSLKKDFSLYSHTTKHVKSFWMFGGRDESTIELWKSGVKHFLLSLNSHLTKTIPNQKMDQPSQACLKVIQNVEIFEN
jgi:hypothetical protein